MRVRYCGEMPEHTPDLTSGKWYDVSYKQYLGVDMPVISDDVGDKLVICIDRCAFLDMDKWEVEE